MVGLRTDNFNFASQRAIEKLGAKKDGVIRHHWARPNGTIRALHFTADGQRLLSSGWWTTDLWDIAQRRRIRSISLRESSFETKLSADGRTLVSSFGDGTLRFWDLTPDAGLTRLADHSGRCYGDLSPDGRLVVTGSDGDTARSDDGTARVWDAATGKELFALEGDAGGVRSAAFDPGGGRVLAVSDDGTARVWDGRPLKP